MAVGEDYHYYSDSDDDDDVDRYVFLARQPEPARRHEDNKDEDASDDDDDETEDEGRGGDGRRTVRKRPLREEVSDASPSSPKPNKKARLGLIIALPSAEQTSTTTSPDPDQMASSSPRGGVRDRESSDSEATHDERPDPRKGRAKNIETKNPLGNGKKRRRSSPGCDDEVDQEPRGDAMTQQVATSTGRFRCSLCERCYHSHQALGGHVLGHQKKARIAAIAAAARLNGAAGVRGNCKPEIAGAELDHAEQEKPSAAVAASERDDGRGNGGNCHKTKAVDDAVCREDGENGGHGKPKKKKKKPSVVAEDHMGAHGDGNIDTRTSVFAARHDHDRNREKASSRSFHNGGEETAIGAGSHDDADVRNKKSAAGASRNVDACRTQVYECKVCGTECLTGRALGGHMRKHRKRPVHGADGDGRSETDGDSRVPLPRQFGATDLQRSLVIEGEASS